MMPEASNFQQSIAQQIALNRARTPTQRFQALGALLDATRAMAPQDPESRHRRQRVLLARQRQREELREHFRRIIAAQRQDPAKGV